MLFCEGIQTLAFKSEAVSFFKMLVFIYRVFAERRNRLTLFPLDSASETIPSSAEESSFVSRLLRRA
jgi:hypothetical protein